MEYFLILYIFAGPFGSLGDPSNMIQIPAPTEESCMIVGEKLRKKLELQYHRSVTFECISVERRAGKQAMKRLM